MGGEGDEFVVWAEVRVLPYLRGDGRGVKMGWVCIYFGGSHCICTAD